MSSHWKDLGVYTCEKCSLKTQDETIFRHHPCKSKNSVDAVMQYDSKTGLFNCTLCKIELNNQTVIEHLQLHLWEKPFKCSICGVEFLSYTEVTVHCNNYHPQNKGKISLKFASYTISLLNEAMQNGHAAFKPKNHNVNLPDRAMHIENFSSYPPSNVCRQPVMSPVSSQNQDKNTVQSLVAFRPKPLPSSISEVLKSSYTHQKMINSAAAPLCSSQVAHPSTNVQRSSLHRPTHLTQSLGKFLPEKSMCMPYHFQEGNMTLVKTNCLQETFNACNANQVGISFQQQELSSRRVDSTSMRLPISVNNNPSSQHKTKTVHSQSFSNNPQRKTVDSVPTPHQSPMRENFARTPDSSLCFLHTEGSTNTLIQKYQSTDSSEQKTYSKSGEAKSKFNTPFLILVRNFFLCLNCKMKWKASNKTLFLEHIWKEHAHPDRDFSCCSQDKFSVNCSRLQTLMASQFKSNYADANYEVWQKFTNNMAGTNVSSEISDRNLPSVKIHSEDSQTGISVTSFLTSTHAEVVESPTVSEKQIEEEDISSASDQLVIDLSVLNTSENSEDCSSLVNGSAPNKNHEKEMSQELGTYVLQEHCKEQNELNRQIESSSSGMQVPHAFRLQSSCSENANAKSTNLSRSDEFVTTASFAEVSQYTNPHVALKASSKFTSLDVKKQPHTMSNGFVQDSEEQLSDSPIENTYRHNVIDCISDFEVAPELTKCRTSFSHETVEETNRGESRHITVALNAQNTPQNPEVSLCKTGPMFLQSTEKNDNIGENVDKMYYKCGCHTCTFSTHKPQDFLVHLYDLHKMEASFPCIYCRYEETFCNKLIEHMNSHVGDANGEAVMSVSVLSCEGKIETVSGHNFEMTLRKLEHVSDRIKTDIRYLCNECDTHFPTLKELSEHLSQSVLKVIGCGYCDSKFLDSVICNCHIVQEHAEKTVYRRVNKKLLCKDRKDNFLFKKSRDSSSSDQLKRNSLTEDAKGVTQDVENKKPETDCKAKNVGYRSEHNVNFPDSETEANSSSTMLSKTVLKSLDPHRNADNIQNCISEMPPGNIAQTVKLVCGSELSTKDVHMSEHTTTETPVMADSIGEKSCSSSDSERETAQEKTVIGSCVSRSAVLETGTFTCLDILDPLMPADETEKELKSDRSRLFDLCGSKEMDEYLTSLYFLDKNQYRCGGCNKIFTHLKWLHCHIFLCLGKLGVVFCCLCDSQFENPKYLKNHFKEHTSAPRKLFYCEVKEEVLKELKADRLSPEVFACLCKKLRTSAQNLHPEVVNSSCDLELDMPNMVVDSETFVEPQGLCDSSIVVKETNSSDMAVDKAGLSGEFERRQPKERNKERNLFSFAGVYELELSVRHGVQDQSQSIVTNEISSKKPKLKENSDQNMCTYDKPSGQRMDSELEKSPSLPSKMPKLQENSQRKILTYDEPTSQRKGMRNRIRSLNSEVERSPFLPSKKPKFQENSQPKVHTYDEPIRQKDTSNGIQSLSFEVEKSPSLPSKKPKLKENSKQKICTYDEPTKRKGTTSGIRSLNAEVESSPSLPSKTPKLQENSQRKVHTYDEPISQNKDTSNGIQSLSFEVEKSPSLPSKKLKLKENSQQKTCTYDEPTKRKGTTSGIRSLNAEVEKSPSLPSKKPRLQENNQQKICTYDEPIRQGMDTSNETGSLYSEIERLPSLQNSLSEKGKYNGIHHSKMKKDSFADDEEDRRFKCSVCKLQSHSYTKVKKHVQTEECCQFAKVKIVLSENGKSLMSPRSKEKAPNLKHKKQKKEGCNYICQICHLIVPWSPSKMQNHIDSQHPFYCTCGHCGSIYYMRSKLINHSRFVHRGKEIKVQEMNYSAVFSPVKLHPTDIKPGTELDPQSDKTDRLNFVALEGAKNRNVVVNSKCSDKKRIKAKKNMSKNSGANKTESTRKEVSLSKFSSSHKIKPAGDGSKQKTHVLNTVVQKHRKPAQMASKSSTREEAATFLCDSKYKEYLYETKAAENMEKENSSCIDLLSAQSSKDLNSKSVMTTYQKSTTAETPTLKGKDKLVCVSMSTVQGFCEPQNLLESAPAIKPLIQAKVYKVSPEKNDFPFECTQCQTCVTSIFYLKSHFKKKHAGEIVSFIERRSESIFNSSGMQLGGKSGSTPSERHLCGYCPFRSEFRTNVLKHSWGVHNKKYCVSLRKHPDQGQLTETKGPSGFHMSVTSYRCHLCCETVSTEFMFRLHLAKHGGFTQTTRLLPSQGILICPCCGYIAKSSLDHAHHIYNHQSDRRFACSLCGRDDHFKKNLQNHIKAVHSNDSRAQMLDRNKLTRMVNVRPSLVNLDAKVRLVDPFTQNEGYLWKLLLDNSIKMIDVVVEDCENILSYRNRDFFDIKVL